MADSHSTDHQKALDFFSTKINGKLRSFLNSCVHCSLCAESCHYFLSHKDDKYIPGKKVDQLANIYRRYHTAAGKIAPKWFGAKDMNDETIEELIDVFFGGCTMCGRCSIHCSVGIDIPYIVRIGRSMLFELNKISPGLQSTVDTAVRTGNNMGISEEELIDTLEWLEEDLQMEVDDKNAKIPLNKGNVNIMYTLNPREPKFFPLSISAAAKIFYAAKENWSLSTNTYDVTNYAYFSGDDRKADELTQRIYDETKKFQADKLALAECGHGFRAIRWEGPNWLKKEYPFKVDSIVEVISEYIRTDRITLDPFKNTKRVTLHDPCNMVRSGGVIEEQRFILNKSVENFTEMTPNRSDNFCCGGGGGQLAMSEYAERRIKAGEIKANQIRESGAEVVATPCHNCIDQLMELNSHYKLNVEIKTIGEIVAKALVL